MYKANVKQFVDFVRSECKANGVKLMLRKRTYVVVSRNLKCSGYFDGINKELVVAINQRGWLGVLVHEFAHMTQWLDNCKAWKDSMNHPDDVDDWLNGKELKNIKRTIAVSRNLELDNEKRSVKLIKQWNLPIDIKDYTQKANAYIQFYNWLYFTRRWCSPDNSPYKNPKVYKEMPTVFRMNYRKMSDKYMKIFEEAGI
jgi:hypothetical protein